MDKHKLIDKAVNDRKGINKGDCIIAIPVGNRCEMHVSPEEFTKRAKELGWVSGYLWGKEYPTNGKKPDLDDDVIVCCIGANVWLEPRKISAIYWGSDTSSAISSFRIVDERYKPVEVVQAQADTNTTEFGKKEFQQDYSAIVDAVDKAVLRQRRKVFGVGINDAGYTVAIKETVGYVDGKRVRKNTWECPFYKTWTSMLRRCYSDSYQREYPTYRGCEVFEDWLIFSNFKAWMGQQDWIGKHLDKDLLGSGKIYSPNTCCFIGQHLNKFLSNNRSSNTTGFTGVKMESGKFLACISINGKQERIGYFDNPESASEAYDDKRSEVLIKFSEKEKCSRIKSALLSLSNRKADEERRLLIEVITSAGNLSDGMLADAILAAGFTNNKDNGGNYDELGR